MITSMMGRMADAEKLSIPQLQMAIKNGTIPAYVGVPLLQDKMRQHQQAMASQQGQQQQAPIAEQVMQEAGQYRGIDELPTNLPTEEDAQAVESEYANGGIIAFADEGQVKEPKKSFWDTVDPKQYKADPAYKAFVDESDATDKTYKNYLETGNTLPLSKKELADARFENAYSLEQDWRNSPEGKKSLIQAQQMGEPDVTVPSKVKEQYWNELEGGNKKEGTYMAEYTSGLKPGDYARMRTSPTPVNPETASDRAAVLDILKKGWAASQDVGSGMTRGAGTVADYFNRGIRALGVPETLAPRIPDQYTFHRSNQGLTPFSDALRASNAPTTPSASSPQGRLPVAGGDTGAFQTADRGIATLPAGQRSEGTTTTPTNNAGQRGATPTSGSGTTVPAGSTGAGGGALPPTLAAAEKSNSPVASQAVSMLDRYVEMLEKSGKDVDRDKKEALYMALIKGGFIAAGGTSPNALANIAAGMVPAVEGYSKDIAGIRKDERARLEKLVAAGVSKEKILNEAKKLGITEKHFDQMYSAEMAKLGVMGGQRADARAQAEDLKRLSVAQGLFKTLRSDQMMSGKSDDELWNQAQIMSGQIEAPAAPKNKFPGFSLVTPKK